MSDPTKPYTPQERAHLEMLRKRLEKLALRDEKIKQAKEATKK